MKGMFHLSVLGGLIILVLVVAISGYILAQYVLGANLNFPFSDDSSILKQHSTCALAYCAAGGENAEGVMSDEVDAVGCLQWEGGTCKMSCRQVEQEVFLKKFDGDSFSFESDNKRKHYCGKKYALEFEFDGVFGGGVPLKSGQMAEDAKSPWWVCRSARVPFLDRELDDIDPELFGIKFSVPFSNTLGLDTASAQYGGNYFGISFPQNCIMLSKSKTDTEAYGETIFFFVSFIPGFQGGKIAQLAPKAASLGVKVSETLITKGGRTGIAGLAASGVASIIVQKTMVGKDAVILLAKKARENKVTGKAVKFLTPSNREIKIIGGAVTGEGLLTMAHSVALFDPYSGTRYDSRGGCFVGYVYEAEDQQYIDRYLYTPIIQYNNRDEMLYPSAIYVDESFVNPIGGSNRECTFVSPARVARRNLMEPDKDCLEEIKNNKGRQGKTANPTSACSKVKNDFDLDAEHEKFINEKINEINNNPLISEEEKNRQVAEMHDIALAKFGKDRIIGLDRVGIAGIGYNIPFNFGNMIEECEFKTQFRGEKIMYSVWSSPTLNGLGARKTLYEDFDGKSKIKDDRGKEVIEKLDDLSSDEVGREGFKKGFLELQEEISKGTNLKSEVKTALKADLESDFEKAKSDFEDAEAKFTSYENIDSRNTKLKAAERELAIAKAEFERLSAARKTPDEYLEDEYNKIDFKQDLEATDRKLKEAKDDLKTSLEDSNVDQSAIDKLEQTIASTRVERNRLSRQVSAKKPKAFDDAWQNHGSCAYVVLERDLDLKPFDDVSTKKTDLIEGLTITTDKENYADNETAIITGQLKLAGEDSKNKEVMIELYLLLSASPTPVFIDTQREITDENGIFEWQVQLSGKNVKYSVVGKYNEIRTDPHMFSVGVVSDKPSKTKRPS